MEKGGKMISKKVNSVQEWLPVDEILENGIIKDLNNLLYGKTKSKFNTTEYFKFMVFPENQSVKVANQHYINLSKELKENLIIVDETTSFDRKDCIYLIYINF